MNDVGMAPFVDFYIISSSGIAVCALSIRPPPVAPLCKAYLQFIVRKPFNSNRIGGIFHVVLQHFNYVTSLYAPYMQSTFKLTGAVKTSVHIRPLIVIRQVKNKNFWNILPLVCFNNALFNFTSIVPI